MTDHHTARSRALAIRLGRMLAAAEPEMEDVAIARREAAECSPGELRLAVGLALVATERKLQAIYDEGMD